MTPIYIKTPQTIGNLEPDLFIEIPVNNGFYGFLKDRFLRTTYNNLKPEDNYPLDPNKGLDGKTVTGIRVLNIIEENASAVEDMVNKAIIELNDNEIEILNVLATGDNLILVLGEKKT